MNVVIYARFSSHSQTEQSIEGQLKVCYEYAESHNYTVVGEYIDRAQSGKFDNRADFQRMQTAINTPLRVYLYISLTASPATDMTARFIKQNSRKTVSEYYLQKRILPTMLRAFLSRVSLKVWRNTTPQSLHRKSIEVCLSMPKSVCQMAATPDLVLR